MAQKLAPRPSDRLYDADPGFFAEPPAAGGDLAAGEPLRHHNDDSTPAPASLEDDRPTVGSILRSARLEQGGKPISEIAQDLRIRPYLLEALEKDDYDQLPGLIYAAGFLRSYAQYLGLDGTYLVERLKESGRAQTLEAQLIFPEPLEDPRIPRRPIVVMACLMALAVYGAWYGFSTRDAEDMQITTAPGAEFQAVLEDLKGRSDAGGVAAPPQTEPAAPAAAALPASAGQEPVDVAPAQDLPLADPAPHMADPAPHMADAASDRITLKARSAAWVRIEGPDEKPVVDTVLKPGEEVNAPTGRGLVMMTGNAGALEVTVGGRVLGPLGPEGAVRHHVALDQLALADSRLQGQ